MTERSSGALRRARAGLAACLVTLFCAGCPEDPVVPQTDEDATDTPAEGGEPNSVMPGVDEMADALVQLTARTWEGQRTPWPTETKRPPSELTLRSLERPLAVHGDPAHADATYLAAVLESLEGVAAYAAAGSFPRPLPDATLGGDDAFDLYVTPTADLAGARPDSPVPWSLLDAVTAHALLDPGLPRADLDTCVAQAYGEAIALEQDPAEARAWHRAFGAFLAWHYTGRMGCADALDRQQGEPGRPWIGGAGDDGAGGALLLAMASLRHDGGSGAFVRELQQLARQRTWEGAELRGAPDLWEALETAVNLSDDRFESMMEDFAVIRGFLGERDEHSPMRDLRGLGPGASAPFVFDIGLEDLPHHTATGPELGPYGTAFVRVDVRGAPPDSRLRVWLRGEYGVEWGLTASRLNEEGEEIGRLSAPPRRHDRRSYLPVELTPDTAEVLVGVTNLSHRLPDDDLPKDTNARAFRLIFDLVEEGEGDTEPPSPGGAPAL